MKKLDHIWTQQNNDQDDDMGLKLKKQDYFVEWFSVQDARNRYRETGWKVYFMFKGQWKTEGSFTNFEKWKIKEHLPLRAVAGCYLSMVLENLSNAIKIQISIQSNSQVFQIHIFSCLIQILL